MNFAVYYLLSENYSRLIYQDLKIVNVTIL